MSRPAGPKAGPRLSVGSAQRSNIAGTAGICSGCSGGFVGRVRVTFGFGRFGRGGFDNVAVVCSLLLIWDCVHPTYNYVFSDGDCLISAVLGRSILFLWIV